MYDRFFECVKADDLTALSTVRAVAEEGAVLAENEALRAGMLRLVRDASVLLGDEERTRTAHAELVECVSALRKVQLDTRTVRVPSVEEVKSSILTRNHTGLD